LIQVFGLAIRHGLQAAATAACLGSNLLEADMPTEFGHDYNWEHTDAETPAVSCISLGCWCGIAACLNALKLRDAAFPFDWNRTTMQGIIHFLDTSFVDFLQFSTVKAFPESKNSGGKMFSGVHHSVWHEDCSTAEHTEKYHRRISRLLQNTATKLLFIRCLNANTEVIEGEHLLSVLRCLYPQSEVCLLLIVDCQPAAKSFVVEGTNDQLLVYCIELSKLGTVAYAGGCPVYNDAIAFAYNHLIGAYTREAYHEVNRVRSCSEMFFLLTPFFCGPADQVPYLATYLPAPVLPAGWRANPVSRQCAPAFPEAPLLPNLSNAQTDTSLRGSPGPSRGLCNQMPPGQQVAVQQEQRLVATNSSGGQTLVARADTSVAKTASMIYSR